jgi:DNA-binding beta-propeller fold protein YncE
MNRADDEGLGGIAVNVNGNVFASVDHHQHCVYIYSVDDAGKRTAHPVFVAGTAGAAGRAHGQLNGPTFACFVRRDGMDTLLICDYFNDRLVEVTDSGDFRRAIAFKDGSRPYGVAYSAIDDVIAVSLPGVHAVVLLQYESGAVKPEVTIGSGAAGDEDEHVDHPVGVAFTADGRYILVADFYKNRVSNFSASSGAFVALVSTKAATGISYPRDILQCEDGSIVVAQGSGYWDRRVVCVTEDGSTMQNIIFSNGATMQNNIIFSDEECDICPWSLSYSASLNGLVVKTYTHGLFLLRDAWMASSRNAWLSALS